jgi:hypothetical protein
MNRALIRDELCRGLLGGLALLALTLPPAAPLLPTAAVGTAAAPAPGTPRRADFGSTTPGPEVRRLADWVADANDNAGAAFAIVDKREAAVFVFDPQARLRGSSPVLLGSARGDDSVAGIGTRPIELVRPEERTTPAGRFVTGHGRNARGEDVIWVDYDAAVSMHRVLTTNPAERRAQRLASGSADDRRISYGCINLPPAFYETFIRPAFAGRSGIVYVLPELKPLHQVFGSYDVPRADEVAMSSTAAPPMLR